MVRTYPHAIRKRPRRFHKFVPYVSMQEDFCHGDHVCEACMESFAAEAEHNRPGHVWALDDGHVIYLEDKIAESMLGRPLNSSEVAVHKDGDFTNNTRANIEIVTIPDLGN